MEIHQVHEKIKSGGLILLNTDKSFNAFNQFMHPGITYAAALDEMKKSQLENLIAMEIPSITIQSMSRSLENQFSALNIVHKEIKIKST